MYGPPPGAGKYANDLIDAFDRTRTARGEGYRPRTRHLRGDGWAKYTNRLFLETSPYLLQHAHNPVDWYPWGDEAFAAAARLRRPVLVSIGYSTCHWCHVMEEESFEDEEIARCLNENFIAVKVDREERPDVDAVCMSAVQAMTGRGGWPLNVWLSPDRTPFFGGTYFPPRDGARGPGAGFLGLLGAIRRTYDSDPGAVAEAGRRLIAFLADALAPEGGGDLPSVDVLDRAARFYESRFDPVHGGIRGAPKFPSSLPVRFLLRRYRRTSRKEDLDMAVRTLEKMAAGGIRDHVGGGFHRYAVDARWLVPHFEKMLYDNALLVPAYLEAYQATGDDAHARVAREILRFIEREMTSPEGAFYSAIDADSPTPAGTREEGYFFTWTPAELEEALGKERARIVAAVYGVTDRGNFEGRNVLHVPESPDRAAAELELPVKELAPILDASTDILYRARVLRPPPLRDEKILTAWNGLAISAHARAGLVLGESPYVDRARTAARFLLARLFVDGRLRRTWTDGRAGNEGYLEDYAFLCAGLIDLFEATSEPEWLERAVALDGVLAQRFEDRENGGFFMTGDDRETFLVRGKPGYDGAEPSGNSVAVLNLLRLHGFTGKDGYRERAERSLRHFAGTLREAPAALSEMLAAVDFFTDAPKQILIVAPEGRTGDAASLAGAFRREFLPNRVFAFVEEGEALEAAARIVPWIAGASAPGGKATAYVCEGRVCGRPTADPEEFVRMLR